jgi:hypothetical protein
MCALTTANDNASEKCQPYHRRVPRELEPSIRHVLRLNLNDKRGDTGTKEQCMRLVSTLALVGLSLPGSRVSDWFIRNT